MAAGLRVQAERVFGTMMAWPRRIGQAVRMHRASPRATLSPRQIARIARRSGQVLCGLSLVCVLSGGGVLLLEASGLVRGATVEAGWLMGCGLTCAALAAFSVGLSRAARGVADAAPIPVRPDFVTRLARGGEVLDIEHMSLPELGAEALQGQGLFSRIHVADRPAFLAALDAAVASDAVGTLALRLRCEAEGAAPHFRTFEARVSPASAGTATIDWHAPDEAGARAERANDAKTHFLRAMSHELRTPLNSILGFSELLTADLGQMDAARRADYARIIHESGQHLLGLVNGILDLSRVEAGAYELSCEDLDVPTLLESCREMMALEATRRGLTLTIDLPPHLPPLTADPRAVRQMLLNLLSNAVKFTPAGGRIDLEAHVSGGLMHLRVRDTGAGMASADVARLGEPFFQAGDVEQRRAGTGLGLAVVRALAELHRGRLDVASVLGVGTTASVSLPLCGPAGVGATPFHVIALPGSTADRRRA